MGGRLGGCRWCCWHDAVIAMKIVIEKSTNADGLETQDMSIDGKFELNVHPTENWSIDTFVDCVMVSEYMKRAFQAGKRGEKLEVVVMTVDY